MVINMENMIDRIREERKYQKLAIEALIPEDQKEHMDIIEKEVKTVLVNGVLDVLLETGAMDKVMKYAAEYFGENGRKEHSKTKTEENSSPKGSVRKVMVEE